MCARGVIQFHDVRQNWRGILETNGAIRIAGTEDEVSGTGLTCPNSFEKFEALFEHGRQALAVKRNQ